MESNNDIHRTLVTQITQNNEVAFRRLFDLYYQKLFHVALYFLKNKEIAEEAVADVFFIIWRKRHLLTNVESIDKYLFITVKNQALQYLRRSPQPVFDSLELYTVEWIKDENDPEVTFLDKEYKGLIQKAIYSLPDKCRETFRLAHNDKLKYKDIAILLNISEKTVEAHITKAYKKIAEYVKKEYNSDQKEEKLFTIFF